MIPVTAGTAWQELFFSAFQYKVQSAVRFFLSVRKNIGEDSGGGCENGVELVADGVGAIG